MIVGTVLVLASWIFLIFAIAILGQCLLLWIGPRTTRSDITPDSIRRSLWWGLLFSIALVLTLNLWMPLSSGLSASILVIVLLFALGAIGIRRPRIQSIAIPRNRWIIAITAVLLIAVVFLGFAALGPVTNYDSGLYHLGAIKYASDYSTVSGLANLYFPFGYNTSLYPLAAFLGNGPWGTEGFRLANGLIISLLVCDVILRLLATRGNLRRLSVGSWILVIATFIGLVPLVALSDYWVTSPSSDAPVMLLTFVASAYLADGLWKQNRSLDLATSFVVAVILFSLRPTMAAFLVGVLTVIVISIFKYRKNQSGMGVLNPLLVAGFLGITLLVVQTFRDYYLSGWFQFPLSIYSFDTPWTAIDPAGNRAATLGNARNPEDIWGSVEGFAWVGPWVNRLPNQWEPFLIAVLAIAALILVLTAKRQGLHLRFSLLLAIMFPAVITSIVWFFFSPPAFRFGWGPLFSIFLIPIGVMVFALVQNKQENASLKFIAPSFIGALVLGLFIVSVYSTTVRLPKLLDPVAKQFSMAGLQINYLATPVTSAPTLDRSLTSGLVIMQPTESDQCWDNYPLCTPIVSETVVLREGTIQSGFLP